MSPAQNTFQVSTAVRYEGPIWGQLIFRVPYYLFILFTTVLLFPKHSLTHRTAAWQKRQLAMSSSDNSDSYYSITNLYGSGFFCPGMMSVLLCPRQSGLIGDRRRRHNGEVILNVGAFCSASGGGVSKIRCFLT